MALRRTMVSVSGTVGGSLSGGHFAIEDVEGNGQHDRSRESNQEANGKTFAVGDDMPEGQERRPEASADGKQRFAHLSISEWWGIIATLPGLSLRHK